MARFAKISAENIVLDIVAFEESLMLDEHGVPQESIGQAYLETHNNWPAAMWIQGTEARKNGPGIGMEWDPANQIFWPISSFPSWTKDISSGQWVPPVSEPDDITPEEKANHIEHWWDEENQEWKKYTNTESASLDGAA